MSLASSLGWALLRATSVAMVVVWISQPIASWFVQNRSGWWRKLAAVLIVAPFLMPGLVVAYAYYNSSLSLVHHRMANECLYAMLMGMMIMPVAVGVLYFSPRPQISDCARHCRRLLSADCAIGRARITSTWSFVIRGPMRTKIMAFTAVFLLGFQEFEMASLFGANSWTVWLFAAQVGGLAISQSLLAALIPAACEAVLLLLGLFILLRTRRGWGENLDHGGKVLNSSYSVAVWGYLLFSVACICVVPATIVLKGTLEGLRTLVEDFSVASEVWVSIVFSASATIIAVITASIGRYSGRIGLAATVAFCLPGLLGALVLSLVILSLFQLSPLAMLYDTPVPLVLTLSLLVLPMAMLLHLLLESVEPGPSIHLARLLGQSGLLSVRRGGVRLHWHLRGRVRLYVILLLFMWVYFDVVASSLLAPTGMIPATARLYNMMHYGHSAVLSAMVCVMVLAPVVLALMTFTLRAVAERWLVRG